MPRLGLLTTKHQAVRAGYGVADDATGSVIAWAMNDYQALASYRPGWQCNTGVLSLLNRGLLFYHTWLTLHKTKNRTVKGLHLLQCVIYGKI